MQEKHPNRDSPNSRYFYARKAVKQVLEMIPDKTPISVLNFGGKKKYSEPMIVQPPTPWNAGRLDNLMGKLESSSLNNNSPIANAIIMSMEKGFPEKFKDTMLIVVLTDGMDNCSFDPKNEDDNTKGVIEALKAANSRNQDEGRKIDVVVVCFLDKNNKQNKAEYQQAEKQFKRFTENGAFIAEAEGEKLGQIIVRFIVPRVQLRLYGKPAPGFEYGQPVNYRSERYLSWHPLKKNNYKAILLNDPRTQFDVDMAPGHNIFAMLKREQNKLILERGVVGLEPEFLEHEKYQKADWLVTLLENAKADGGETRRQWIAFEKTKPEANSIRQSQPGFVWLELETQDGKKPEKTLEWGSDLVVPAAAFAVKMTGWPGGAPKLTAWFWPESWKNLLDNVTPIMETGIDSKVQNHLIERVGWETREVSFMTPQGEAKKEKKPCLVVRARYDKGKPVYVGLKGINESLRVGSEHQFFHSAERCTACFYFDGPPPSQGTSIVLIDVEQFKAAATKGGTKVEFTSTQLINVPNIFRDAIRTRIDERR